MVDILTTRTKPRKLNRHAEEALHDLFVFGSFYLGLDLEEQPHREMCDVLMANEREGSTPYTMLVVPRDCFKSTIAARALPIWKQLRRLYLEDDLYYRIVIVSSTLRLVETHLSVIEQELRYNTLLNTDFEPLWQNKSKEFPSSHGENGITIGPRIRAGSNAKTSEPSFWIGSIKAARTGLHADEAVVDDLSNDENSSSPFQRLKTQRNWKLLQPILGSSKGSRSRITAVGTRWHDDDVIGMILREEKNRVMTDEGYVSPWTIMHRSAINEDGSAFFPSRYPIERLDEMRVDMSPREFACNYLNDPVGDQGFVNEEEIVFRPREVFPALRDGRICVDPNQHDDARELGCYAAICVAAYDRYAKMWVQDIRGSREWGTNDLITELFELQELYPYPIFMEDSHMSHFAHAVSMEEARRSAEQGRRVHLRINYVPTDPKSSKYERARRLIPRFKNRNVYFADEIAIKLKAEMKEELVRGPEVSRFKDFLDALAMCETGVRPRLNKDGSFREIDQNGKAIPGVPPAKRQSTMADAFPDIAALRRPN